MICKKCGKKLDDSAKFCVDCGIKVKTSVRKWTAQNTAGLQDTASEATGIRGEKEKMKKQIVAFVAAAVLLGGGVVTMGVYFSPTSAMNRAIAADDFEEALSLYHDKLSGKALSDRNVAKLVEATMRAADDYEEDKISYETASARLNLLSQFGEDVYSAINDAWKRVNGKLELENQLDYAAEALGDQKYTAAISAYEAVLALDSENAAAQEGLQTAKDELRQSVLTETQNYQEKGDFKTAAAVLENALSNTLPDDADLQEAFDRLDAAETTYTIEKAYAATEAGEWEEALEMIETCQEEKGQNHALKQAYEDIEKKRPITLVNLTMVSSDHVEIIEKVIKDRWGKVYDRGVRYNVNQQAYGYYALEKKYTKFSGVVFPSEQMGNEEVASVSIYKDDQLAFHRDDITVNTPPISFELDINGATTLKIVTDYQKWDWDGYLDFGNTHFEKVGEAQEKTALDEKTGNTDQKG